MSEWEAYNRIEPIGELRGDLRIAQLTSTFYNFATSFGSKNGRRKVVKASDFMPFFKDDMEEPQVEQSVDEMKSALFGIANSLKEKNDRQTLPGKKLKPPKKGAKVG